MCFTGGVSFVKLNRFTLIRIKFLIFAWVVFMVLRVVFVNTSNSYVHALVFALIFTALDVLVSSSFKGEQKQ